MPGPPPRRARRRSGCSLAREVEGPSYRKRFLNARLRSAVTDHDVHPVRLPAQQDVRGGASAREALEARSPNRGQALQRRATPLPRASAGGRGRLPADDDDHRARGRNGVSRELAVEGSRPDTGCSDHEERARVAHRARSGDVNLPPARRDDDPDAVGRDRPLPAAAPGRERRECQGSKNERARAHLPLYEPPPTSGPRGRMPEPHIELPSAARLRAPRECELPNRVRAGRQQR